MEEVDGFGFPSEKSAAPPTYNGGAVAHQGHHHIVPAPLPEYFTTSSSEADNRRKSLKSEDIRLVAPDPTQDIDDVKKRGKPYKMIKTNGLKTKLGKGKLGGKIGAIKGDDSSVNQETSEARETLIVQQPGRPRAEDEYLPVITPKPADKAGHILFAMDIPKEVGHNAKIVGKKASRIVINKCQDDRSAQICLEYYTKGTKGKKGKTKEKGKSGQGTWIEPSAANAICRETIEINSFNVSEVQRVNISLHTLSTITEDRITVKYKKKKEADRTEYYPIGLAGLCGGKCPWVNMNGGEECCCFFCVPISTECFKCSCLEGGKCGFNLIPGELCPCCCCWTDEMVVGKTKTTAHESSKLEPFDLVNVTEMEFILRQTSKDALEDDRVKFTWRVQSVGQTEHDLKYVLAKELHGPCLDPTSTARTLANIIHYLNA